MSRKRLIASFTTTRERSPGYGGGETGASWVPWGGTCDGEGSPSHKNHSNILCAFSKAPLCRMAPVLPRWPGPLIMISRDGIHGGM
jgi:hypothetical protein